MSEVEELIFGLNRYIKKCSKYVGTKSIREFVRDEMAFDATCFCFYMIDYIVKEIFKHKDIIEGNSDIDFKRISEYKNEIFPHDSVNYVGMYEIVQNEFPLLQVKLMNKLGAINYGK